MAKDLAIVLNNGSLNSAVATALAAQKYRPIMLNAEIAPQPGSRSRAAYDQQVAHFKPYREHSLPMPFLAAVQAPAQQSAMMTDPRLSAATTAQLIDLLPLVAAAARFAVNYQAAAIYLGLRVGSKAEDLAQATEYIQVWNELVQLPMGQTEMEIIAPLMELDAWQAVDLGFQINAPLDRTWSCLEDTSDPCWACRGCRSREAAFQQSGKPDPLRVVRKV
jgi:7-cyano-7-deazaguanine synthase in queuosine biosynthesis